MTNWSIPDLWAGKDAVFLITAMEENERLVRELAHAQTQRTPELFDGLTPVVYRRLPYVAPYETFNELRMLALQIRDAAGLRAEFRGIVALDLSEWLGHETDNYLKVTFKYLHDHRSSWKSLFVAGDADFGRLQWMMQTAAVYLRPRWRQLCLFHDKPLLQQYIAANLSIEPEACQILARLCTEIPAAQNCSVMEQIFGELKSLSRGCVSCRTLYRYLRDDSSLLVLLNGGIPESISLPEPERKEV